MIPSRINNQKICIACLNWGMGHLSRCIPIINRLLNQNNIIFFAGNESQIKIIQTYFDHKVKYLSLEDYPFKFKGNGNFSLDILVNLKKLKSHISTEQKQLRKWEEKFNFDIVISDHRYGFYSKKSISIFITHQVYLPTSFFFRWINLFHHTKLKRFNYIWVPDDKARTTSFKLSKPIAKFDIKYIGILSRFELYDLTNKLEEKNIIVLVSGPDPYAKLFFENQAQRLEKNSTVTFILPRKLNSDYENKNLNVHYASNWKKVDLLLMQSKKIIATNGYSTLMDLRYLKKEVELYPTKGQKEQEYLAKVTLDY